MGDRQIRLATRGSPLARYQAQLVADRLTESGHGPLQLVIVSTTGDQNVDVSLDAIGGQGVFVKEVQSALLAGKADIAVHSAKDLPALTPPGLTLACVPERGDPRDALVGTTLAKLPTGATVATGSVRRRAQLAWLRPDLSFTDLRGNMHTRVERARAAGAGVVAYAALQRLGIEECADEVLGPRDVLPQVGQGTLAVECRADDEEIEAALGMIDDPEAHRSLRAERAFLGSLGGGCSLPVAALAWAGADGSLLLDGLMASRDGRVVLRHRMVGADAEDLGRRLADHLLHEAGGRELDDWARP